MPARRPTSPAPLSRPRRIGFALAALFLIPLLALLILEGVLRLFHVGYPTAYLLARNENGATYLYENDKFGWRFFPAQIARNPGTVRFSAKKEPGVCRIFLLGESAALGDPRPAFSMGRYLEVLLQERYPAGKFEVITTAMTAINSHALLAMARECARYEGDFWILYMGNNEMEGPFGVNPISGAAAPNLRTVRIGLALRTTRVGQLLERVVKALAGPDNEATQWLGIKMFREHRVAPLDPRKEIIYGNFRQNLRDILRQAGSARPILCTVASNLRDFAPLASMHGVALAPPAEASWQAQVRQAVELQNNARFTEAAEAWRKVLSFDPDYADAYFHLAQALLQSGATNALADFQRARDMDALPFRTDTRLNQIIRETAAQHSAQGAVLADLARDPWLELPAQAPGDESFFDHVHFTFLGNYRAARALAARMDEFLPPETTRQRSTNWASVELCDRRLALTDWNRRGALEEMLQRQSEPPFTDQSNYAQRIRSLAREVVAVRQRISGADANAARRIYEEAIAKNPADFNVRKSFAEFFEATGRLKEAAEQWIALSEIIPQDALAPFHAGRLFGQLKMPDLAISWLNKALAIRPNFPEAHLEIGRVHHASREYDQALAAYARALELRPQDARVLIQKAHTLAAMNRREEGVAALRAAIKAWPENWEPQYLLGVELAATDRVSEALPLFQQVTRLRPGYAPAHFNLAVALSKSGRIPEAMTEFNRTLELDPGHKMAREYLNALQAMIARQQK